MPIPAHAASHLIQEGKVKILEIEKRQRYRVLRYPGLLTAWFTKTGYLPGDAGVMPRLVEVGAL
jgi:hypothetical protein